MARINEIERRLGNWARWKAGSTSGGLGFSRVNLLAADGGCNGYREATIPTTDCEAEETDRAIQSLDRSLQETLAYTYLKGWSLSERARRLGCAESTVKARIVTAHHLIERWLTDLALKRKREAERVEALIRSVRPTD